MIVACGGSKVAATSADSSAVAALLVGSFDAALALLYPLRHATAAAKFSTARTKGGVAAWRTPGMNDMVVIPCAYFAGFFGIN